MTIERVIVCGGREYRDHQCVYRILNSELKNIDDSSFFILIQGGATGADQLVRQWAIDKGIHCATVPALWGKFDKSAGPKRNRAMLLLQPTKVVAFPGGKGTRNMVELARAQNIPVRIVNRVGIFDQ